MRRLAIITTHPIQYNAPFFKLLASQTNYVVKVFYTLGNQGSKITDRGFGKKISWDIPLLDGYDYTFVVNVAKTPSTGKFNGVINPSLISEIKAFTPTDILVFGWSFNSHLKVLRYFKGKINILFRGDSTLLDEKGGLKSVFRRIALSWIYKNISKALYVGTNNKNYFIKHNVPESKLIYAPHAIDNDRFGDDSIYELEAEILKKDLGIKAENVVFLFTGKYEKKKNPLLLIRAFKQIENSHCILLMVGNGVLESDLRKEAEGASNILFLPFQNQSRMPVIYRTAHVLVLPSDGPGETWGLCINEAMACGLAIIGSNKVGCAVDLIKSGKNGEIFEAGNFDALRSIVKTYSTLPIKDIKLQGSNSKELIQKWNYNRVIEAIEKSAKAVGPKL